MADTTTGKHRETWLVAAWPGMGNIAVGAAAYLINKLEAHLVQEIPARGVFDLSSIVVKDGLATAGRLPRSLFFELKNPDNDHDLLIFLGEAQPPNHGYAFCHRLLEEAMQRKIDRVITFAAMATQLHPSDAPRVFGVATEPSSLEKLRSLEVSILKEGQISGLNGVLLAAAAERKIPAMCLMGELPFFAAAIPNPRASLAVLESFCTMTGIDIDLSELREQAATVEKALLELLQKLQEAVAQQAEQSGEEEGFTIPDVARDEQESSEQGDETTATPSIPPSVRRRIDKLFDAVSKDRTKALALKQELDKLGVFKEYEDRFLDLFKKAD